MILNGWSMFRLEERVLFEAAAATEVVEAIQGVQDDPNANVSQSEKEVQEERNALKNAPADQNSINQDAISVSTDPSKLGDVDAELEELINGEIVTATDVDGHYTLDPENDANLDDHVSGVTVDNVALDGIDSTQTTGEVSASGGTDSIVLASVTTDANAENDVSITVTVDASKSYDGSNLYDDDTEFGLTLTVGGQTYNLTLGTDFEINSFEFGGENAGEYADCSGSVYFLGDYSELNDYITDSNTVFIYTGTINKAQVTVDISASMTYNASQNFDFDNGTISITIVTDESGLITAEDITVSSIKFNSVNVGEYDNDTASITTQLDSDYDSSNFDISYNFSGEITKATLIVYFKDGTDTVDDVTITYDGKSHTIGYGSGTTVSGLDSCVKVYGLQGSDYDNGGYETKLTVTGKDAGEYVGGVTAVVIRCRSGSVEKNVTSNYDIIYYTTFTLTILPAEVTVTVTGSKTYDGSAVLDVSSSKNYTITLTQDESKTLSKSYFTLESFEFGSKDAGSYDSSSGDGTTGSVSLRSSVTESNYNITYIFEGEIAKASVTISGSTESVTYNGKEQTYSGELEVDGLLNGDTISNLSGLPSGTDAGSYSGTFEAQIFDSEGNDVTNNYEISCGDAILLTILPAEVIVTVDVSKTYDGSASFDVSNSSNYFITVTNDESGTLSDSSFMLDSFEFGSKDAGSYDSSSGDGTTGSLSLSEGFNESNYNITYIFEGEIAKASVTISGSTESVIYNGSEQTYSGEITVDGLVTGDTISNLSGLPSGTDAGTYTGTLSDAQIIDNEGNDVTNNYEITYGDASLSIVSVGSTTGGDGDPDTDGSASGGNHGVAHLDEWQQPYLYNLNYNSSLFPHYLAPKAYRPWEKISQVTLDSIVDGEHSISDDTYLDLDLDGDNYLHQYLDWGGVLWDTVLNRVSAFKSGFEELIDDFVTDSQFNLSGEIDADGANSTTLPSESETQVGSYAISQSKQINHADVETEYSMSML